MSEHAAPPHNRPCSERTYSALAVANYILQNSDTAITNLKLQKMLYFIQGFSLSRRNKPIFDDEIQAWTYGPVVPVVYREYMDYGSSPISKTAPADIIIEPDIRSFLNALINSMRGYSAADLVRMTHLSDTPWSTIWDNGRGRFNRIPISLIKDYFDRKLSTANG